MISNIRAQSSSSSSSSACSVVRNPSSFQDRISVMAEKISSFLSEEDNHRILISDKMLLSEIVEKIYQETVLDQVFKIDLFHKAFNRQDFLAAKRIVENIQSIPFERMCLIFVNLTDLGVQCFLECAKILKAKQRAPKSSCVTSQELGFNGSPGSTCLMECIAKKNLSLFYDLIERRHLDPHEESSRWGGNALFRAVYPMRFSFLVYLVEMYELNIESKNKSEETPLFVAVDCGNIQSIGYLLSRGANPNIETVLGDTPLKRAIRTGNSAIVKLLIDYNADIHVADKIRGITPIMQATECKDLGTVKALIRMGCDLNVEDKYGGNCISRSILKKDLRMCQFLVGNGAFIRDKDVSLAAKRNINISFS